MLFILETNGILLGADPGYVNKLKKYKNVHIRVSLKAGTPEGFERRTGGRGKFYELPYRAVEYLNASGMNFHVAAMTDSRMMPKEERAVLIDRLQSIGYNDYLEEEQCDPYPSAKTRLQKAGFHLWKR